MPAPKKPQKLIKNMDLRNHVESIGCICRNEKCWGVVKCHHVKSVGSGGKDEFNLIPLCQEHHTSGIHTTTNDRFERLHGLSCVKSLAIVFTVSHLGTEIAVDELALMRGIDRESAESIILNAIENIEKGTKSWVG